MTLRILNGALLFDKGALAINADCCPPSSCESCCSGFTLPNNIIVDLGAGGLTGVVCDDAPNSCQDIAGEFTVPKTSACTYDVEFGWCFDFGLVFAVQLARGDDGCGCIWRVTVAMSGLFGDGNSLWETTEKTFLENDCTLASAVTVNEIHHIWNFPCVGSLPAAITIKAAP